MRIRNGTILDETSCEHFAEFNQWSTEVSMKQNVFSCTRDRNTMYSIHTAIAS